MPGTSVGMPPPRAAWAASVGGFAGAERSEFGANPLQSFVALRVEVAY